MVKITVAPTGETFDCAEGDTIMRAAIRAGIGLAYSCNVGSCGNCRFELIEGQVRHLRTDPPAWSERDLKRNRWLGCQAAPEGDCTVKFRTDDKYSVPPRPMKRRAKLLGRRVITRDISAFDFEVEGAPDFLPGQYALLSRPEIEGGRPYSFANLLSTNIWSFLIKKVPNGRLTSHIFSYFEPGAQIDMDGPWGTATLDSSGVRDVVLIAGGSGLSPMVSIAHAIARADEMKNHCVRFYYGARQQDDLFDAALLPDNPRMELINVLSDPLPGWNGRTGFVHQAVENDFGTTLASQEIYFAGPAAMSGAIQQMTQAYGVPMTQLHFDEFY